MSIKIRLIIMNFLQFAVLGGAYPHINGQLPGKRRPARAHRYVFTPCGNRIVVYACRSRQIIADRWIPAQKLLSFSHFTAALFMAAAGYYGMTKGAEVDFGTLFTLYSLSVAFYMPTLALSNSVAYTALDKAGLDTIRTFPPIRIFGTIGFICSMWVVDLLGLQNNYGQFFACAIIGVAYGVYALTLPECPTSKGDNAKSLVEALGLRAFTLFKQKKMAVFFIFSMLLGVSLQITNGFANPYISSFGSIPEYAGTFGVQHANILISLSQISETLCILLIPFFLKRFGIKQVMLIAMLAWVLRFGLFRHGNPGSGVWMFVLSMIVYGVAFDFFNISGSLFVDRDRPGHPFQRRGLFVIMTNGFGATIGNTGCKAVVNHFVDFNSNVPQIAQWQSAWYVFAIYALTVAVVFAIVFKYKHHPEDLK